MYIVKYKGAFGFIKPAFAVRDEETISQKFLTPSTVAGMERKLFPELLKDDDGEIKKIVGHRLSCDSIDLQIERVKSKGERKIVSKKDNKGNLYYQVKNEGILKRGVMINPVLYLIFTSEEDAKLAFTQSLCLCRNEDIIFPEEMFEVLDTDEIPGYELVFNKKYGEFVGYNRFKDGEKMFGIIKKY